MYLIDRRQISSVLDKSTPLRETKIERHNNHNKTIRNGIHHQDSLEDVPDINSNNQDVCFFSKNVNNLLLI